MKFLSSKYVPLALLALIPFGILYRIFEKVLACPSCYLFEDAGDGLKNYFTFAWYILNDRGVHFSGMNAPYGEHIFFTDNHPGLAMLLGFIHRNIIDLSHHTVGLLNVLIIASFLITTFVLYRIFRLLAVGRYSGVAFAILITFLSPQIARLTGHFSLSYSFFIPVVIWIILKWQRSGFRWKWTIIMTAWILVMGFTHLYHFLMTFIFLGGVFLVHLIKNWTDVRTNPINRNRIVQLLAMCVVPTILLLLFLKVSDPIPDRPTTPWRHHGLNAKFNGTFVPNYGMFRDYWRDTFGTARVSEEGRSYVGLVGLFMLPAAFVFLFRRKKKKSSDQTRMMHTMLVASLITWAVAAGILYSPIFSWLLDWIPKLKQFRGMGRLAWVFYYTYLIFIGYYLYRNYRLFRLKGLTSIGKYILVVAILVTGFEAYLQNRSYFNSINKSNTYLNHRSRDFSDLLRQNNRNPEDFQAILQLPLISLGGETSGISRGNWTMRKGIQAAFELHIPMIDWSLSRTSVDQSLDFIQLLSSSAVKKERLTAMDHRPLLLVCEEGLITESERGLVRQASYIGEIDGITLYALDVDRLQERLDDWRTRIDTTSVSQPPIIFHDFEENPHPEPLLNDGVLSISEDGQQIYSFISEQDSITEAILHLWLYIDQYDASMSVLRVKETDLLNQVIYDRGQHRSEVDWSEVVGHWIRLDRPITIRERGYRYDFYIDIAGTVIDGLQIRPTSGHTVIKNAAPGISFYDGVLIQ